MLFKKMLRDLWFNKAQFISIFLMMFIGVFIYTGVNSEWQGMQASVNKYYQNCNMADEWVYGANFTEADKTTIQENENVTDVDLRMLLPVSVKQAKIDLYVLQNPHVSKMQVVKGKAYRDDINGVWLEANFAEANHYNIGDKITFQLDANSLVYEIVGLVNHPEYIFAPVDGEMLPDHHKYGYAFVSAATFADQSLVQFNQLVVKTKTNHFSIPDLLKRSDIVVVEREYLSSHATIQSEIEQHQVFGGIFPVAFLLIAFLTTITTMSKLCMNQRQQIGILKALGFKTRTLLFHYLSHIMLISTLGVMLGYLLGPMILPNFIFTMMNAIYYIPDMQALNNDTTIIFVIGCLFLSCFITFLVCRAQVKEKPVDALLGKVNVKAKPILLERVPIWSHLSFNTQWNLRDISRNKLRCIISVFGVFGCSALLFCAFSLADSTNELLKWNYEDLQKYEMKIDLQNQQNQADMNIISDKMDGECIQEIAVEIKAKTTKKVSSSIMESDRYVKLMKDMNTVVDMQANGIYLSYKLATSMGIEKGDSIQWRNIGSDKWHTSKVNEIIHTPFAQGISMAKDYYEASGETFLPTSIVGKNVDIQKKDYAIIKSVSVQSQMIKNTEIMLQAMNVLIMILVMGATILGVVVLYNFASLSYYEKEHDMATLKVLGFKTKQLKGILRQQHLWLTSLGIILGIPGGYVLLKVMLETTSDAMDIIAITYPLTYLICIFATLLLSQLVLTCISRRLKTIDMVAALKARE